MTKYFCDICEDEMKEPGGVFTTIDNRVPLATPSGQPPESPVQNIGLCINCAPKAKALIEGMKKK
jgi:hypothetical protein